MSTPDRLTEEEAQRFNLLLSKHLQTVRGVTRSVHSGPAANAVGWMYATLVNSEDPCFVKNARKAIALIEEAEALA